MPTTGQYAPLRSARTRRRFSTCQGLYVAVRDIAGKLGEMLGKKPLLVGEEPKLSQVINDDFCVKRFGNYMTPLRIS